MVIVAWSLFFECVVCSLISGYCCHLLYQWSKFLVIHNVGDKRQLSEVMKMVNKFIIEEAKLFENKGEPFAFKVGVSLFTFLLCQFCAHCSHLPSISMLVHDLSFQAFSQLVKCFYFQLLLCLLIRVIKSFAKSFYFLNVLFVGRNCWKFQWNLLHSRSLEFSRCSLLSLLKLKIVKSFLNFFCFLTVLSIGHNCWKLHWKLFHSRLLKFPRWSVCQKCQKLHWNVQHVHFFIHWQKFCQPHNFLFQAYCWSPSIVVYSLQPFPHRLH